MINKYKNIIIVAVIIGVGLIAYSFLRPEPTFESQLQVTERQTSAEVLGNEISSAINQINSLRLDRTIFDDPVLNRLIDHSRPIIPEPVQRNNPFAPIGQETLNTTPNIGPEDFEVSENATSTTFQGGRPSAPTPTQ